MPKFIHRSVKIIGYTLLGICILLWIIYFIGVIRNNNKNIIGQYTSYGDTSLHILGDVGNTIRVIQTGNPNGRMLVLIHGAPGSMHARNTLLKNEDIIHQTYNILLIDRPGYAGSYHGKAIVSLADQAAMLAPVLDMNTHPDLPILVGHSLGSPIALLMAADFPEKVGGVISIAGAIDPASQIIWWPSYILHLPLVRSVVAPPLRVTNAEKLVYKKELEILLQRLQDVQAPVVIMHGTKDWIVPVASAYVARDYLSHTDIHRMVDPEQNHFLPFDTTHEIINALQKIDTTLPKDL